MSSQKTRDIPKLKDILRLFYSHALPGFPVVDHHLKVIGILMRRRAMQASTQQERLEEPVNTLQDTLIERITLAQFKTMIPAELHEVKIPVLDTDGNFIREQFIDELIPSPDAESVDPALLVVDHLPMPVVLTDENGIIQLVNNAFLHDFMFTTGDAIGAVITALLPHIQGRATKRLSTKTLHFEHNRTHWRYRLMPIDGGHFSLIIFESGVHQSDSKKETETKKQSGRKKKKIKIAIDFDIDGDCSLQETLNEVEAHILGEVFAQQDGNISATARVLRVPRQTLQYKLEKYTLEVKN